MPRKSARYKIALLSLLSLPGMVLIASGGSAAAVTHTGATHAVTTSSLGSASPTFTGTAATGCASGCNLLSGPTQSPSTAHLTPGHVSPGAARTADRLRSMPFLRPHVPGGGRGPAVQIPTVSCAPASAGCDSISTSAGGATGVKGLNAVDSASAPTNKVGDIEPPDQGLCAGNGYVVETNNIGEILIFNTALKRVSAVIPLDTLMGLTKKGWSSGGDPSCVFDPSNGGHWFFTEIASASPESKGGPFAGCFAAVAKTCYEGIAVTKGDSPFGPYNNYFLNANYNPKEPGYPYQLNDYAKISVTRDAFLLFYDEFPLKGNGIGGGFFNGAQEFAFNKNALEEGLPVKENGAPNPDFTVAIENMGLLKTPNGTCASDNKYHLGGIACWFSVIPALPPAGQWDNSHGGSGFMLATLDFYTLGGNQLAGFDWTGLENLNSDVSANWSGIKFGGTLFSGVQRYYDPGNTPSGLVAPQKAGPIPLGDECGAAGLSVGSPPPATCPENGLATNSDQVTQAAQGNGQLWAGVDTQVVQTYSSNNPEAHMGAAYFVVGTSSFDKTGQLSLTSQGYITAMHEELEFPAFAAGASNGHALVSFTVNGNGGEFVADNGGFYPSSAYGRVTATSGGLSSSTINIADMGQSPQDGFSEYQGYPSAPLSPRPRWGDYGAAILLGGKVYFASEYIQSPNCTGAAFTLTVGTCGGTRDGFANWGTSVNSVTP